jgi:LysM repeat protein
VRAGDTVWEIARRFGISVASLHKLNNLGSQSQIYPGQKLLISRRDSGSSYKTYTVKQGDTIYAIANFFNTTVARILSWNDLSDPRLIRAGEQLIIYSD